MKAVLRQRDGKASGAAAEVDDSSGRLAVFQYELLIDGRERGGVQCGIVIARVGGVVEIIPQRPRDAGR